VSDDSFCGDVGEALARAAGAVAGARQVALACHVNPDGDALGSMLGLLHVLRAAGANVVASFPPPFLVAPHYRELPGLDLVSHPDDFPTEPDVMVTFDCGSLERLGDLEPAAKAARELVVIDHHISNSRYGTINVIDPDAAASGVLGRRLVHRLATDGDQRAGRVQGVRDAGGLAGGIARAAGRARTVPAGNQPRSEFPEHRALGGRERARQDAVRLPRPVLHLCLQ